MFGSPGTPTYDKRHMVPGFEDTFLRGDKPLILQQGDVRFGVAICKDMDFPGALPATTPVSRCCWCLLGTLNATPGCIRAWPSCAAWNQASRWCAVPVMAGSL